MTMFDPEKMGRLIRFLAEVQKERRMTATLPPFDLVSVCPKCGMMGGGPARVAPGTFVVLHGPDPFPVEYHPDTLAFGRFPCSLELNVEHLHRTCSRCSFAWAEACPSAEDFLPIGPQRPVPDFQFDAGRVPARPVRPEVAAFALLMERELAKHDDRIGWKGFGKPWFLIRLREQVERLAQDCYDDNPGELGHRAADAANFLMFIADVGGALKE